MNRSDHLNYTPIIKVVHAILKYRKLPKTEADEHLKKYKDDIIFYSQMIEEHPTIPNLGVIKHTEYLFASIYGNYKWIGYKHIKKSMVDTMPRAFEIKRFKISDAFGFPKFELSCEDGKDEYYNIIHNINDNQIIAKGSEVAKIIRTEMTDFDEYDSSDITKDEFNTLVYFAICRSCIFITQYENNIKTDIFINLLKYFSVLVEFGDIFGGEMSDIIDGTNITYGIPVSSPCCMLNITIDKSNPQFVVQYKLIPYMFDSAFRKYDDSSVLLQGENVPMFVVVSKILNWKLNNIEHLNKNDNFHIN